jgi:hypothetical protein
MAARRERERRRPPADRRYRFAAPESAPEADEMVGNVNGEVPTEQVVEGPQRRSRSGRRAAVATAEPKASSTAGEQRIIKPFSAYASEYAYVVSDLRRVALVIGSLLVILIALYSVLPH